MTDTTRYRLVTLRERDLPTVKPVLYEEAVDGLVLALVPEAPDAVSQGRREDEPPLRKDYAGHLDARRRARKSTAAKIGRYRVSHCLEDLMDVLVVDPWTDTHGQEGPTGVPWRMWHDRLYYDALICPSCTHRARGGGCGDRDCPLLHFNGAGLPGCAPGATNHPSLKA